MLFTITTLGGEMKKIHFNPRYAKNMALRIALWVDRHFGAQIYCLYAESEGE